MDFQHIEDRKGTSCVKWDHMEGAFGRKDLLPLWVADMDFKAPAEVLTAVKERVDHGVFGYTRPSEAYYASVVDWMRRHYQWTVAPEEILITPGVVPAINMAIQLFTEPGDEVIIQTPVYPPFASAVGHNGRVLSENVLVEEADGSYTIDFSDLEERVKHAKMMVIASPHNPVGKVFTEEELRRMGELCLANGCLLISDEIHADLTLPGVTHTPLTRVDERFKTNSIVMTAASKTFNLAGFGLSNIIIQDPILMRTFKEYLYGKLHLFLSDPLALTAVETAYRYGDNWLERLMGTIDRRFDFLSEQLETHLPQVRFRKPEATYLAWLDFRALEADPEALKQLMVEEAGVALNPGDTFGATGAGFLRLNVATSEDVIAEAIERIAAAFARRG